YLSLSIDSGQTRHNLALFVQCRNRYEDALHGADVEVLLRETVTRRGRLSFPRIRVEEAAQVRPFDVSTWTSENDVDAIRAIEFLRYDAGSSRVSGPHDEDVSGA